MLCNGQKYNNLFLEELIANSQPKTSQRVLNENKPTWLFVSCEFSGLIYDNFGLN